MQPVLSVLLSNPMQHKFYSYVIYVIVTAYTLYYKVFVATQDIH